MIRLQYPCGAWQAGSRPGATLRPVRTDGDVAESSADVTALTRSISTGMQRCVSFSMSQKESPRGAAVTKAVKQMCAT
jgi:hypothetical protein